jgi:Domain of unknown function (DUF4340)
MNADTFVKLGIAAVLSTLAAIAVHASNNRFAQPRMSGTKLIPMLSGGSAKVASMVVGQGAAALTLEAKEGRWTIKERAGYPVDPAIVRTLLTRLAEAERVEAKTRNPERLGQLDLDDPTVKDSKARALTLLDAKGGVLADLLVGKQRSDAFGSGKGGTYIRQGKDPQTWLTNAAFEVPGEFKRWINPQVFETDSAQIKTVKIEQAGEVPLELKRADDGKVAFLAFPPEGKKLRDLTAADQMVRASSTIELDDVRRLEATPTGEGVSVVSLTTAPGLVVTVRLRKDADAHWASISATGDGDGAILADVVNAKTKGWEFKISSAKVEQLLKKRADLIEAP